MSKLDVDTKLIETLAKLLQDTGLTEIELSEGDARIRVARQVQMVAATTAPAAAVPAMPAAAPPAPDDADDPGAVTSPMVGTVFMAPEPGAANFVTVGAEVSEGQTLLIIEAMKVMNPIRSPMSGRVARILVKDSGPVEFGEVLLVIE